RQLFDAHLKYNRVILETEHALAAGVGVHLHVGGPPAFDAFLGSDGAINLFRRRGDAYAMHEVCGHNDLSSSSTACVCKHILQDFRLVGSIKKLRLCLAACPEFSESSTYESRLDLQEWRSDRIPFPYRSHPKRQGLACLHLSRTGRCQPWQDSQGSVRHAGGSGGTLAGRRQRERDQAPAEAGRERPAPRTGPWLNSGRSPLRK